MKYLKIFEDFINQADLEIRPSSIEAAGNGLFTNVDINEGDDISQFTGRLISKRDANRLTGERSHYLIQLSRGRTLDVYDSDCLARFANDSMDDRINAEIQEGNNATCWLVALRDIKAGEEIFCSYGPSYWDNWQE